MLVSVQSLLGAGLSMLTLNRGVTAALLLPLAVESGPGPGPVNGEVSNDEEGSMNDSDTGDLHDQDSLDSNDAHDVATPSGALNLVSRCPLPRRC